MAKDIHRFHCPCCHKRLEFETSSGRVREVDAAAAAEKPKGPALDDLVTKQKAEAERLHDAFSQATRDTMTQADKFDNLFSHALEEAKKDKDKKPRNPFDLE